MTANEQIEIVRQECHKLAMMLVYDKIRIEYNNNRKVNDLGRVEVMPIFTKIEDNTQNS